MKTAVVQPPRLAGGTPRSYPHGPRSFPFDSTGSRPRALHVQSSLNWIGSILILLTIIAGLLFTAAGRDAAPQRPPSSSFTAVDQQELDGDEQGLNAPGGGYEETPFSFIVMRPPIFDQELLDGHIATLESWEITPAVDTRIDTSSYQSSGIAVMFIVQGGLIASFTDQVMIVRRVPLNSYPGTEIVEPGAPVELVTGDAVAYEIGQTIVVRNPFSSLATQIQQVIFSHDSLPVDAPEIDGVATVSRENEQKMPRLLSTMIGGIYVGLSTYRNIPGTDVNADPERTLFAPEPLNEPEGLQHGFVINIGEPTG